MKLNRQCRLLMQKAGRSLNAAENHLAEHDFDFASSRAYYAAFYAVEAVLLTKNLTFSKHSALIGAFNKHFIKCGIFPKEFSKLLARLFRDRQTGDYSPGLSITEIEAKEDISASDEIGNHCRQYLEQEGFLT